MHIKANPKYGSEKKGQPTTFYATLAPEPIRLNCELKHVDVVLSPDPNVFRHSRPARRPRRGRRLRHPERPRRRGVLAHPPARGAARPSASAKIKVFTLDAFEIARTRPPTPTCATACRAPHSSAPSSAASPLLEREGASEETLFEGIEDAARRRSSAIAAPRRRGQRARDPPWLRRGRARSRPSTEIGVDAPGQVPHIPAMLDVPERRGRHRKCRTVLGAGLLRLRPGRRTASPIRSPPSARFRPRPARCAT